MSQFRRDPISGRWVIIADERGKRPHDFDAFPRQAHNLEDCPFCPGNEAGTPPEVYAVRPEGPADGPGWQVRVVPNKFPAVAPLDGRLECRQDGLLVHMDGAGAHEVVIESPEHAQRLGDAPLEHIERVLDAYAARMSALYRDERVAYVQLFKNKGSEAGASLSHTHSQIVALPLVPHGVQVELDAVHAHHRRTNRCLFCDLIAQELDDGARVIERDEAFVTLAPFASRFPFEVHILPRAHEPDFAVLRASTRTAFARALKRAFQRLDATLHNVPHNFVLHTRPHAMTASRRNEPHFHWHLEILPRLTTQAGFEWGTDVFINPTPPEAAAAYLRRVELGAPQPV